MMDSTSAGIRHLDQLQCSTTTSFSNMRTCRTQFVNCSVESVELLIEDNIATSLHLQCPRQRNFRHFYQNFDICNLICHQNFYYGTQKHKYHFVFINFGSRQNRVVHLQSQFDLTSSYYTNFLLLSYSIHVNWQVQTVNYLSNTNQSYPLKQHSYILVQNSVSVTSYRSCFSCAPISHCSEVLRKFLVI